MDKKAQKKTLPPSSIIMFVRLTCPHYQISAYHLPLCSVIYAMEGGDLVSLPAAAFTTIACISSGQPQQLCVLASALPALARILHNITFLYITFSAVCGGRGEHAQRLLPTYHQRAPPVSSW